MKIAPPARRAPVIEEIEPRILYSADFSPLALAPTLIPPVPEHRMLDPAGEFVGQAAADRSAASEQRTVSHELVFIDPSVPDSQSLIEDIRGEQGSGRRVEVVVLDAQTDGIKQIGDTLAESKDITAVHLIAHGRDGALQLGNTQLDFSSLLSNASAIKRWGEAFTADADLMLYGCDAAQTDNGRAMIEALARLTGADVAASGNPTGSHAQGGDWDLEYRTGSIETDIAISAREQSSWNGLLEASGAPSAASLQKPTTAPSTASPAAPQAALASAPLAFEQNSGQSDAQVDFLARGNGYGVWLTDGDAVLSVRTADSTHVVRLDVVDANASTVATGESQLQSKTSYFRGTQDQWRTGIANYGSVLYNDVYDGIDLRYYGSQSQLEYDFIVDAGANVDAIRLRFQGVQSQAVADNGDLTLTLDDAGHTLSFKAPIAYQDGPHGREAVTSHYLIAADGSVGFAVGAYDQSRALVIDPVLTYGTYFGGNNTDNGSAIAVDPAGNVYITGYTQSSNLPGGGLAGGQDAFVVKFSPDLSTLEYAAYIGGGGTDQGHSIAVDASGSAYVTGHTVSNDFPLAAAFQSSRHGSQDAFVFKLNAAGDTLVYSTYLGGTNGTDSGSGIAVDGAGSAYVTGGTSASDFPTTAGAWDTGNSAGDMSAFVTKFNAAGTSLVYSTYLGGSSSDTGRAIAVDSGGNAVVVGETNSANFPTVAPAYQSSFAGTTDAFVVQLDSTGANVVYGTYIGGNGKDVAYAVTIDGSGKIYITGETSSTNYKITAGAYITSNPSGMDGFMSILNPTLSSLVYSTYLGGAGNNESGQGIGVDNAGLVYVAGYSDSNGSGTGIDAFVVQINPAGAGNADLLFSALLGSGGQDRANDAVYSNGKFYLTGDTVTTTGIATVGSYDTTYNGGGRDGFVAIYTFNVAPSVAVAGTPLAYSENAGALALDANLTVTDSSTLSGATVQITGNYVNGEDVLAFVNAAGIIGTWTAATGTLTLLGSASVANYQAALRSVTYQNTSEKPNTSTRTVTFTATDGTLVSAPVSRQISVTSVDDPPVNTVAGAQVIDEGQPLIFSVANGNSISTADVDAGSSPIQVTLTASNGNVTVAQTAGLTFVTGTGSADSTMTFTGTVTSINAALDGLQFDPTLNFNGTAGLQIVTSDQGNSGSGGPLTATSNVTINVNPVNSPPSISVPGPQATATNTPLILANGNAISISDADAAGGSVQVTLTVAHGTLALGSLVGLGSVTGDGTGTVDMLGTLASINNALNGLTYTPAGGYGGPDSLSIATNDQGNTGVGGVGNDADVVNITVSATSAAPVIVTSGSSLSYTEQAGATAIDTGLTVSDADTLNLNHAIVHISANYVMGEDVLSFTNQLGISGNWDVATGTLTLTGSATPADYEIALRSVTYQNASDKPSTANRTISFVANDGIADGAVATRTVTITDVNDTPIATVPAPQTVDEDATLVFSASNGNQISINDLDAGASPIQVALTATNGIITLAQTVGLTIAAGSNGSAGVTVTGTISDLNAALNGLSFRPAANYSGIAGIAVALDDLGNTGTGGAKTSNSTVNIGVVSVNDAPAGVANTVTTREDTFYTFAAADFGFSDANDSPGNARRAIRITTLATAGTLINNGAPVALGQFVLFTDIASGQLVFNPARDGNGAGYAAFTFQLQDDGGVANGGIDLDSTPRTMTVDVTTVNDPPVSAPSTVTTLESTSYTFTTADFSFNDPNDAPADSLFAVNIGTLPAAGSLTLANVAVTAGQSVAAGSIALGDLKFTPIANASGAGYASFAFALQDTGGTADGGTDLEIVATTMTIDVTQINLPPQGADGTITALEDTPYVFGVADFGFSDPNDSPANNLLAVKVTTLPGVGSLTDNGVAVTAGQFVSLADIVAGTLTFSPTSNTSGPGYATFTFQVQDDGGTLNGSVDVDASANTITVNVASVNDAPAGADNTVATLEDTPYVFNAVDFGFSDAVDSPANTLLGVQIAVAPAAGVLRDNGVALAAGQFVPIADITGGKLTFDPALDGNGTGYTTFAFQVRDNGGAANGGVDIDPLANAMTIDVTAVNDAPAITLNTGLSMLPGGTTVIGSTALQVVDPDNTPVQVVYTLTALPVSGGLLLNGVPIALNGTFTQADVSAGLIAYSNTGGASTVDSFAVAVDDGAGGTAGPLTFVVSVANPPVFVPGPAIIPPIPLLLPTVTADAGPSPAPVGADTVPSNSAPADPPVAGTRASLAANDASETDAGSSSTAADGASGGAVTPRPASAIGVVVNGMASSSHLSRTQFEKASFHPGIASDLGVPPTQTLALNLASPDSPYMQSNPVALAAYKATLSNDHWIGELNRMRSAIDGQIKVEHKVIASTVAITGSLSVGYVMWLLRGGLLLSSLVSSLPAWHVIDPLPVLSRSKRDDDKGSDDDPLEKLFGRAKAVVAFGRQNSRRISRPSSSIDSQPSASDQGRTANKPEATHETT